MFCFLTITQKDSVHDLKTENVTDCRTWSEVLCGLFVCSDFILNIFWEKQQIMSEWISVIRSDLLNVSLVRKSSSFYFSNRIFQESWMFGSVRISYILLEICF